jgi:hypothetical protein
MIRSNAALTHFHDVFRFFHASSFFFEIFSGWLPQLGQRVHVGEKKNKNIAWLPVALPDRSPLGSERLISD